MTTAIQIPPGLLHESLPAGTFPATANDYLEVWLQTHRVLVNLIPQEREQLPNERTWGKRTDQGVLARLAGRCSLDEWFRARGFVGEFNERGDLLFPGISPMRFFGDAGFDNVLTEDLSYDQLVEAVQQHIAYLQDGNPVNWLLADDDKTSEKPTFPYYIERWQEALRVLESLTPHEREHKLDMSTWGKRSESGFVACLAGLCSLDEWFRVRGFIGEFNENGELKFTKHNARDVFGDVGHQDILVQGWLKYDELVNYVKGHIAYLEDGNYPYYWPFDTTVVHSDEDGEKVLERKQ